MSTVHQATCVAVGGVGLLVEGVPGSGKSSLALALIDRGAVLVGDDSVVLTEQGGTLRASPHPNIRGKLEVRNLGLFDMAVADDVPLALVIRLDREAPRFIDCAQDVVLAGAVLPMVRLWPDSPVLALRAEMAVKRYGRKIISS